jgi:hypothetical protein
MMASQTLINSYAQDSLNRAQLIKLKQKAMRSGAWFKALHRLDRVLVDLTIKVTESVRSSCLVKRILAVIGKLQGLESNVMRSIRVAGHQLAQKLSLIAERWGNVLAKNWATDLSFAFFLALNSPSRMTYGRFPG